jgi:hypothetical protein
MRFTIRDLLWLTVVVAVALGWWLERTRDRQRFQSWQETTWAAFQQKLLDNYQAKLSQLTKENAQLKAAANAAGEKSN